MKIGARGSAADYGRGSRWPVEQHEYVTQDRDRARERAGR